MKRELNNYFTYNNKGDVGVYGVSENRAKQDLEYNREKYPEEEWEMDQED